VVLAWQDLATAVLDTFRIHGECLPLFIPLTPREIAVLELVAAGRTNSSTGRCSMPTAGRTI
jgi:DNA-binding NarL/FixJ family response regulator